MRGFGGRLGWEVGLPRCRNGMEHRMQRRRRVKELVSARRSWRANSKDGVAGNQLGELKKWESKQPTSSAKKSTGRTRMSANGLGVNDAVSQGTGMYSVRQYLPLFC